MLDWLDRPHSATPDSGYVLPQDQTDSWKTAGFKSSLVVPLMTRIGVTGYLAVLASRPNAFNEPDSQFLLSVAQHVAPHLSAASLLEASIKEAGLRRAQSEVARAMSMSSGLDALCEVVGPQVTALLNCDIGFIAESKQGMDTLTIRHRFGKHASIINEGASFAWDPDFAHLDDEVRASGVLRAKWHERCP